MTIKQQGGVFGRNPTFNDVEIDGTATLNSVDATSVTTEGLTVNAVQNTLLEADQSGIVRNLLISNADVGVANRAGMYFQPSNSIATSYIDGVAEDDSSTTAKRDGSIVFGTRLNGSFTDQVKITSQGNIAILNSGKGIDFSATAGTGTSELFNDYEEGVYTATLTPATSGTITITTTGNELAYTKIGRLVYINGMIIIDSVSSPVGASVELNLPFASSNLGDAAGRAAGTSVQNTTGSYAVTPIYLFESDSGADILFDASTVVAGHRFYISLTYITG